MLCERGGVYVCDMQLVSTVTCVRKVAYSESSSIRDLFLRFHPPKF